MNMEAAEFFFSEHVEKLLQTYQYFSSKGTRKYLEMGRKIYEIYMNRKLTIRERIIYSIQVLTFLLSWWSTIKNSRIYTIQENFMTRGKNLLLLFFSSFNWIVI